MDQLLESGELQAAVTMHYNFPIGVATVGLVVTPGRGGKMAAPPPKAASEQIAGIDVLELENAQQLLWQQGIYAETGMGCTGPVILVASEDRDKALTVLKENNILVSG